MPDVRAWPSGISTSWPDTTGDRATSAGRLIGYETTSVTVHTRAAGGDLPDAQNVRLEALRDPRRVVGEAATEGTTWIVAIGYKDHHSADDTDLKRGDRFTVAGVVYAVHATRPATSGRLEAYCMAER